MNSELIASHERIVAPGRKIDQAWWNNYLQASNNMDDSVVMASAFGDSESLLLQQGVRDTLRRLFLNQTKGKGMYLHLDNELVGDQEMKKLLFDSPPGEEEDINQWTARTFPDRKFTIFVSHAERYSEPLSILLAGYFAPLVKTFGFPLNGMQIDFVIGHYGYTPIGIHHDGEGENIFHFHLGPEKKIMYNWDAADYIKLPNGVQNCMDIEPMLPFAKKFTINQGDVYYMPWHKYHIGYTSAFSIAIAITFYNPTRQFYLSRLLKQTKAQYFNEKDTALSLPENNLPEIQRFDEIESLVRKKEQLSQSLLSLMEGLNKYNILRIASNLCLASPPFMREEDNDFDEKNLDFFTDKVIRLTRPFNIYYKKSDEGPLRIFTRLYGFEFEFSEMIVKLIDSLNKEETIVINDLLQTLPTEETQNLHLQLIAKIYNRRGIQTV